MIVICWFQIQVSSFLQIGLLVVVDFDVFRDFLRLKSAVAVLLIRAIIKQNVRVYFCSLVDWLADRILELHVRLRFVR